MRRRRSSPTLSCKATRGRDTGSHCSAALSLLVSSLLMGALGGLLFADALSTLWPTALTLDPHIYAIIGMGALSVSVIGGPVDGLMRCAFDRAPFIPSVRWPRAAERALARIGSSGR
jgi:hypothetical protein